MNDDETISELTNCPHCADNCYYTELIIVDGNLCCIFCEGKNIEEEMEKLIYGREKPVSK
jgi:hypothetical protein